MYYTTIPLSVGVSLDQTCYCEYIISQCMGLINMCLCVAQEMMSPREPMMIALNVCYSNSKDNNVFSSLMPLWPSFFLPSLQFSSHISNLSIVSWIFVFPFRYLSNLFWLIKFFLLFVVYISLFQISSLTNLFALLFPLADCVLVCFISPVVLWFSKNDASEEPKNNSSPVKDVIISFCFYVRMSFGVVLLYISVKQQYKDCMSRKLLHHAL